MRILEDKKQDGTGWMAWVPGMLVTVESSRKTAVDMSEASMPAWNRDIFESQYPHALHQTASHTHTHTHSHQRVVRGNVSGG